MFMVTDVVRLRQAVLEMSADESYHLPTKGNDICLRAVKAVIATLQTSSEEKSVFCDWLVTNLNEIVERASSSSTGCLNRERLWTEYYQLQISSIFTVKWKNFLNSANAPPEGIFFQHCTKIVFDNLLKEKFPLGHDEEQQLDSEYSLTYEEENAIRYVGGYVIVALRKHEADDEMLLGLDHLTNKEVQEAAATSSSAEWVEEVNRGGLTRITEEAYQFFIALEISVRSYLTLNKAHTMDDTTRSRVKNGVFADSDVQFSWCLTGIILKIGESSAEELLEMCIDKWLTVRGHSFADSIQEMFKQQTKKGTAKAKALRKTIQ